MKNDQFHIPFIKNLVTIVFVTLVSMVTAHFFIHKVLNSPSNSSVFTSSHSQISSEKQE